MPQDVEFEVPFPSRTSPHAAAARARNLTWAHRYGLLGSAEAEQRYRFSQVAECGSYCYLDVAGDDLDLLFDVMGWFFLFDDQFETRCPQRIAKATAACQEHILVVSSPPGAPALATRPTAVAFADCWRRMCEGTTPRWRARTAHAWVDYFTGQLAEVADGLSRQELDFETHLARRRQTIGVFPSLCLAERTGHLDVPDLAWHSTHLKQMQQAAVDQVICVNEVFSLEKEEAHGSPNLIHDLMRQRGYDRVWAIHYMRDLADRRMQEFVALDQQLPQLCERLCLTETESRAVVRYSQLVGYWLRGNYDWHRATGRYRQVSTVQGGKEYLGALTTEDLSTPKDHPAQPASTEGSPASGG
ncbi:terpene synthase family protein [Kitasatospora viridis]|uniref:Terpene synthase n=1 Tax=Kitasatospora viridis TaxID=281105 RepID=A0A561TW12_9ACTN|nr:hypothetical protein [Kitasatospora viridis]TWF91303.1 pentalenene synthase/avermitilol synthase [Kitasatospora viridis]